MSADPSNDLEKIYDGPDSLPFLPGKSFVPITHRIRLQAVFAAGRASVSLDVEKCLELIITRLDQSCLHVETQGGFSIPSINQEKAEVMVREIILSHLHPAKDDASEELRQHRQCIKSLCAMAGCTDRELAGWISTHKAMDDGKPSLVDVLRQTSSNLGRKYVLHRKMYEWAFGQYLRALNALYGCQQWVPKSETIMQEEINYFRSKEATSLPDSVHDHPSGIRTAKDDVIKDPVINELDAYHFPGDEREARFNELRAEMERKNLALHKSFTEGK